MTETKTRRHIWTKAEIAHLNRSVSNAKKKIDAFDKIASEMGLTKQQVAATYYNHRPKTATTKTPIAKKAIKKSIKQAMPVGGSQGAAWYDMFQQGRPYDFQRLSEKELLELSEGLRAEVARRSELLLEINSFYKA